MKEVECGWYAGLFDEPPFEYFVQSPVELVPKAGNKTRLIFHLSYDFGPEVKDKSINFYTPPKLTSVKYQDLDLRVLVEADSSLCKDTASKTLVFSKTDASNAFRIVPMLPGQRFLLIMQATHPVEGTKFFFMDKCLPFGVSISCAIFQSFWAALRFIAQVKIQEAAIVSYVPAITNYLDDFLFIELCVRVCSAMMQIFLSICAEVNCPMSEEKTEGPFPVLVFLGTLLNGVMHTLSIPVDKVEKATYMLKWAIDKKKVTIKFVQQLTGTLNFLNRAIVPGHAFTRGLYSKLKVKDGKRNPLKAHHHVYLNSEFLQDCWVWLQSLGNTSNKKICRPFIDFSVSEMEQNRVTLLFFTDASKNPEYGIGAIFKDRWFAGKWTKYFITKEDPSIEFLELKALVAGLFAWRDQPELHNGRVNIYCDNQAVQGMINTLASTCNQCRKLIRLVALLQIENIQIFIKFVKSRENGLADNLSRQDFSRFWKLAANECIRSLPDDIPEIVWPAERVWMQSFSQLINNKF